MIIVPDRELEVLRHRLTERDVTIQEIHRYLELNHQPHQGMVSQLYHTFVTPQDIPQFWWLFDWWDPVRDKPIALPSPTIIQFCWYVNHTPGAPAVTFNEAMQQFYQRCVAHCKLHDLDPANPGESAEERKRRRNRERMAKVRGHRSVPQKAIKHDETLAAQVRGLEAQCDLLKNEAKAIDEQLRLEVLGHQTAMMDASQRRKTTAQDFKDRIEVIRAEINSLIAKQ